MKNSLKKSIINFFLYLILLIFAIALSILLGFYIYGYRNVLSIPEFLLLLFGIMSVKSFININNN